MTLQEAAAAHLTGTVLIVWMTDDQHRRTSLYHVEVESGHCTVCGRSSAGWSYLTYSLPALAQRVKMRDLCSECIRLLAQYDFSTGQEPSRVPKAVLMEKQF